MMEISVPPSVKSCHEDGVDCAIENTRSVGLCAGDVHNTSALSWTWAFGDGGTAVIHRKEGPRWALRQGGA